MPDVFLSPSTQEYNPYVGGGNEEYYMNILTDALIPYLDSAGISYGRNDTSGSFLDSVRRSNADNYTLHLALHSNASPPQSAGSARGSQIYYFPNSSEGKRAADIFADAIRRVYPDPSKVSTVPTTTLGEIVRTKAPASLIEVAYHDNPDDAEWIRDNIDELAQALAQGIAEFLGRGENMPDIVRYGTVVTDGSNLNLRTEPSVNSTVRARIPNGTRLPLYGSSGSWYRTEYNGLRGYVSGEYIRADTQ